MKYKIPDPEKIYRDTLGFSSDKKRTEPVAEVAVQVVNVFDMEADELDNTLVLRAKNLTESRFRPIRYAAEIVDDRCDADKKSGFRAYAFEYMQPDGPWAAAIDCDLAGESIVGVELKRPCENGRDGSLHEAILAQRGISTASSGDRRRA